MKRFENIHIHSYHNGISVKVGCLYLVYQQRDIDQFADDLLGYLKDPEGKEKEIRERWDISETVPRPTRASLVSKTVGHSIRKGILDDVVDEEAPDAAEKE